MFLRIALSRTAHTWLHTCSRHFHAYTLGREEDIQAGIHTWQHAYTHAGMQAHTDTLVHITHQPSPATSHKMHSEVTAYTHTHTHIMTIDAALAVTLYVCVKSICTRHVVIFVPHMLYIFVRIQNFTHTFVADMSPTYLIRSR
jgi:hypothetical protein